MQKKWVCIKLVPFCYSFALSHRISLRTDVPSVRMKWEIKSCIAVFLKKKNTPIWYLSWCFVFLAEIMIVQFSHMTFFLCFLHYEQIQRLWCGCTCTIRHLWCLKKDGSSPCSASVTGACRCKGHVVQTASEDVCGWTLRRCSHHMPLGHIVAVGISLLLLLHSPVFLRAAYAGSSNMLVCSFSRVVRVSVSAFIE